VQSADTFSDPRVRFPDLQRASGLRSMLAAPLRVGDHARGAIVVFRHDVHSIPLANGPRTPHISNVEFDLGQSAVSPRGAASGFSHG
jgi:hypothetical protein